MPIHLFLEIIWLHLIADFFMQTDKMALNKSTSFKWLGIHVATYTTPFLLVFGWEFAAITFATHFITDAITSRGTSYFWKKNERHWFFTLIGFDQAIHFTTLLLTLAYTKGLL